MQWYHLQIRFCKCLLVSIGDGSSPTSNVLAFEGTWINSTTLVIDAIQSTLFLGDGFDDSIFLDLIAKHKPNCSNGFLSRTRGSSHCLNHVLDAVGRHDESVSRTSTLSVMKGNRLSPYTSVGNKHSTGSILERFHDT